MPDLSIARVILYVRDIPKVAAFYERFFGMKALPGAMNGWVELRTASGGCTIALHRAAKSQKSGASMKVVFAVKDVRGFVQKSKKHGLDFGPIHQTETFEFANAKDPAGNSISVSSRGL